MITKARITMTDSYGRKIEYLRLSVTRRCPLRCVYCTDEAEKSDSELSASEFEKIVRAFAALGITKVRLTGGEPLMRSDIAEIAGRISRTPGIKKLVLTTNGVLLKKYAKQIQKNGVSAVNVSLDTLDRGKYKALTGCDCLPDVLDGIEQAQKCGISHIRINSVLIRGQNDGDAESLLSLAKERKIDVRFIELMPFSDTGENEKLIIKGEEILERFPFLKPIPTNKPNGEKSVAKYYTADGFQGRIGFINPISEQFCSDCNRIRVLCDGKIRPCLGSDTEFDIRDSLDDEERLIEKIREAIMAKPKGHQFSCGYAGFHGLVKIGG